MMFLSKRTVLLFIFVLFFIISLSSGFESVDILIASFFNVNPPFSKPIKSIYYIKYASLFAGCNSRNNYNRWLSESNSPAIFNLDAQDYSNVTETMFSQDSPFGIAAKVNASVIVEGLEKDLKESVGEKLNLLHRDHVQSDIDTLSLIQSINEALFTSQSLNEEIDDKVKRDEGYLAMEGLSGVRKLIGFGGIVLCVASELFHLRDNPQNIGLILCRCINRFPEQKGVCYIISALSSCKCIQLPLSLRICLIDLYKSICHIFLSKSDCAIIFP